MKKNSLAMIAAALTGLLSCPGVRAAGWPANYEGVMLQGFGWDTYSDSKWTALTSQADELSQYFKLIWVPNSGKSSGQPTMGYMPIYWFTNHNSSFGTESELRTMISTFKEKGTGIIADVVINHRVGVTSWTDFPTEQWNGQTWHIGTDGICRTDECTRNGFTATGANDTGDDFDGARDLDHTNANVQNNCKNYCKFLLTDLGYAGFRYDMVKGYGGQYTKIYNQYSNPQFSVGEYWDGNYDAVAAWIDATGKTSAAFDFPCKYAINEAFASGDMTKLVWKANGTTDQPAGMIHFGYSQYAVTFVDNHDTYRDGSKFNGNVVAANAFILCSPGTPCVFLPHWKEHKAELKKIIDIRNAVGVHNNSAVKVLQSSRDCYMAEVTGTKGKLVVKIGSSMTSPSGYTDSDIKTYGTDYCIWSKVDTGGGGGQIGGDEDFTVYFDNKNAGWTTPHIHYWGGEESTWPGVSMSVYDGSIWSYTVPAGTTGCLFNAGDGDATKTSDFTAVANHVYTQDGDQGDISSYQGGQGGGGSGGDVTTPGSLYIVGNIGAASNHWNISSPASMEKDGPLMVTEVEFTAPAGGTHSYFNFITATGTDWDAHVNKSDRYGAEAEGTVTDLDTEVPMKKYGANDSGTDHASACKSWMVLPGKYYVAANFKNNTVKVSKNVISAIEGLEAVDDSADNSGDAIYFNLQGVRVENPQNGIYIKVSAGKVTKVLVK